LVSLTKKKGKGEKGGNAHVSDSTRLVRGHEKVAVVPSSQRQGRVRVRTESREENERKRTNVKFV
jgi:hypothetical protein